MTGIRLKLKILLIDKITYIWTELIIISYKQEPKYLSMAVLTLQDLFNFSQWVVNKTL